MEAIEIRTYPYMMNEGNAELLYMQFKYAGHTVHERMTCREKHDGFITEAFTSTEIVGIAVYHTTPTHIVIDALEVKKEHRGNEYGARILQRILEQSKARILLKPNNGIQKHRYFIPRGFTESGDEVAMEAYSRKIRNFINRRKHGGTEGHKNSGKRDI